MHIYGIRGAIPQPCRKAHTRREATPDESRHVRDMALRVIQAGFKALAPRCHPDHPGGSVDQMTLLNQVRDLMLRRVNEWAITLDA